MSVFFEIDKYIICYFSVTEIGIIFNPILKQLFTARRGQGAFYNGKQIHVSGRKDLSDALVISEFGTNRDEKKLEITLNNFRKVLQTAHG